MASTWERSPVWVHGDVTGSNLLVADGALCAVIDLGDLAAGDPVCDLVMEMDVLRRDSAVLAYGLVGITPFAFRAWHDMERRPEPSPQTSHAADGLPGRPAAGLAREAEDSRLRLDGQRTGLGEAGIGDPADGPVVSGVFF